MLAICSIEVILSVVHHSVGIADVTVPSISFPICFWVGSERVERGLCIQVRIFATCEQAGNLLEADVLFTMTPLLSEYRLDA